jgi:hypothetical protein
MPTSRFSEVGASDLTSKCYNNNLKDSETSECDENQEANKPDLTGKQ